jgi:hypothetical protein
VTSEASVSDLLPGSEPPEAVRDALAGRKELALLLEPSVLRVATLLAARCRNPAPWIRSAVGTLGRFAVEVAGGDLAALMARGRADAAVAERSLRQLELRHDGCTAGQLAALSFGPKLWWRLGGVGVPWHEPAASGPRERAPVRPMPSIADAGDQAARDARLVLLALLGTGITVDELLAVRFRDAGSLDACGRLVPDPDAEPLALEYVPGDGGARRLTFLPFEARAALRERLADRRPEPQEPLLLPEGAAAAARTAAAVRSSALISAGNDVNVTLCRATGDFFRAWGMPGARFDQRLSRPPAPEESS